MQIVRDDWAEKPINKTVPGGMKVLTLLNEKGGVGKTTLALHIAMGLAARGYRGALLDGDPQGNSTLRCRVEKYPGVYDLLARNARWEDVMMEMPKELFSIPGETLSTGQLHLIGGNIETRNIQGSMSDVSRLFRKAQHLRDTGEFDFLIIDVSPTPSLLHAVYYLASNALIFPTQLSLTNFDGLIGAWNRQSEVNTYRKEKGLSSIDVWGIVPTLYRSTTMAHKQNLMDLKQRFGDLVWQEIALRTIWVDAEDERLPVYAYDPSSDAALELWEVVDQVEAKLTGGRHG